MLSPSQLGFDGKLQQHVRRQRSRDGAVQGRADAGIADPAAGRLPDAVAEFAYGTGPKEIARTRHATRSPASTISRINDRPSASRLRDDRSATRAAAIIRVASVRIALIRKLRVSHRKIGTRFCGIRARQVMMSSHRFAARSLRRAALGARRLRQRRPRPDHGDFGAARHLHPRQRPAGRGDPGSPHAGRHADDLVQGRLRRRDARQIRASRIFSNI